MMHGRQKSDLGVVAQKLANKLGRPGAESVERRPGPRGTWSGYTRPGLRPGLACPSDLTVYGKQQGNARRSGSRRCFTTSTPICSGESFFWLQRKAAAGVDGVTWQDYERDLEVRLSALHDRLHRGAYRALPSRRQYIAKSDETQRPLGI